MRIVILGCGRVGARLAQLLEQSGYEIAIIDSDPGAFARLPETFKGQTVLGTGIDVDVLRSSGIEHADAFAALTNFDNTNIMACEVAKEIFGVKKVLARIYDPAREDLYHQLGLETICPTTLISTKAREILESSLSGATIPAAPSSVPAGGEPVGTAATRRIADTLAASNDNRPQQAGSPAQGGPSRQSAQPPRPADHLDKTQQSTRGFRSLFKH